MRVLLVTWDGAGNLPPTIAVIAALAARGHEVVVLGHDSQKAAITAASGHFRAYPTAPQIDQSVAQPGFDFNAWFRNFNDLASHDFMQLAHEIAPDVLIIDSMMGPSLAGAWSTGTKLVALVHAPYGAMAAWKDSIDAADLILICSYEDYDVDAKFPKKTLFVGPVRPPSAKETVAAWQRKDPKLPLVVSNISTGIQGPFQVGLLQRIADALSALPVEGVLTTGHIAPEKITAGANVTVARHINHDLTLPQASLFITHAGHGSVMAALRAGVPMICLPPVFDQPYNAQLIAKLGLGEVLDVMAPAPVIAEAATRILNDRKLQKAAKKFAKKKTFEPRIADAVKAIEKLAL